MQRFGAKRTVFLAAATLIVASIPWLYGQVPPPPAVSPLVAPPQIPPPFAAPPQNAEIRRQNPERMSPLQRQLYGCAQRGADWLQRRNKPDGRFVYGFSPALRQPLEEDSYLAQVEATFALARAARFFGNADAGATARQALLTMLLNTTTSGDGPREKKIRLTIPPSKFVNRPAAAGLLILAIAELPVPPDLGADLRKQADELGSFLERQVRPDGSVNVADAEQQATAEEVEFFSGPALLGIIRSQRLQPALWKLDALRKARAYYQEYWRQHKNVAMIPEHTAAFTEAFVLTRDRAFAEFIFEMNDWLSTHQYQNKDSARPHWTGGFMPWMDGKAMTLPPDIRSARAAQSLADACRTAQLMGDLGRLGRYRESLESCLKFLTTLQYTEANTQHFAEWYRPLVVGGFHASWRDGDMRLDYTQQALTALVQYLEHVAELP